LSRPIYISPTSKRNLQKTIDEAILRRIPQVYVQGVHEIERLEIRQAGQCTLEIIGEPVSYTGRGMTTVIKCHNQRGYAIAIHEGKGVHIKNLNIVGPGLGKDERFNPHAGIAIDPTPRKGSTDCKFENLNIEGFAVGIATGASGEAQNSDSLVFRDLWINNCKTAMVFGHSQTRGNIVENLKCWYGVERVFDTVNYGQGTGDLPKVYGGNFVSCSELFQVNNGWSGGAFFGVYAEALHRIGDAYGGQIPIDFFGCHFDLDTLKPFPANIATGSNLNFRGGVIRYYDNGEDWKPMNFNSGTFNRGRILFDGVMMNNPPSFGNDADWKENFVVRDPIYINGKKYDEVVFNQSYREYFNFTKGIKDDYFDMADWVKSANDFYQVGQPVISRHGVVGVVDKIEGKRVFMKNVIPVPEGTQVGFQKPIERVAQI